MKPKLAETKEMVGGCCVCSDENGWTENPLVYCDGLGCNVAVHQACYGIVAVPTGSWFCRKCESQERSARVRCELCPSKDGALKRTDSGGWAHVVCALYIPEVRFGNVTTMEPIMLQLVPQERFNKLCYLCEENSRGSKANIGACMQCNRSGCKNHFHVTCAQAMGLLCEEAGNYLDNVKYCGYCQYHYNKLRRGGNVKTIPPYRPVIHDSVSSDEEKKSSFNLDSKISKIKRRSSKSSPPPEPLKVIGKDNQSDPSTLIGHNKDQTNDSSNSLVSVKTDQNCGDSVQSVVSESKKVDSSKLSDKSSLNSSSVLNNSSANCVANKVPVSTRESEERKSNQSLVTTVASCPSVGSHPGKETSSETPPLSLSSVAKSESQTLSTTSSSGDKLKTTSSVAPVSLATLPPTSSTMEKDRYKRRNKSSPRSGSLPSQSEPEMTPSTLPDPDDKEEGVLTICEERNLSIDQEGTSSQEGAGDGKVNSSSSTSQSQKLEYQPQSQKLEYQQTDFSAQDPTKRSRSGSQDRGRRSKRGGSAYGNVGGISVKRGRFQGSSSSREAGKDGNAVGDDLPLQNLEPPLKRGRPCKVQEPKDSKEGLNSLITNGIGSSAALLLGNQINPTSSMAQRMADTLNAELEAHSIYKQEEKFSATLMGPTLPGKRDGATSGSVLNSAIPPPLPQSLEELLERQWEQGSQFLMEQAQHFDIASLLSCLHQLRQENVRLEETVGKLVARRDHLLAVNARLSVPLTSSQTTSSTGSSSTSGSPSSSSNVSTVASSVSSAAFAYANSISGISSTIAGQLAAASSSLSSATSGALAGHGSAAAPTPNAASVLSSRHHSHQRLSGESGPNAHSSSGANNLGSRGASPHERRSHQTTPIENGLETEYRYRSPGSEHQHRQHSPMLPRGAQPSPTSMRQSPASASYHSSSPHSVVPSLSPSSGNPQAPPPHHQPPSHGGHAPPAHGGHSHVISSSHGSSHHTVSLSRVPDPSRAELVRLTSSQPHSSSHSTVSGYPVYQMVSPPVHGPHHSPVGLAQHPQVLRREVVESVRNSHPLDAKR